MKERKEYKGGFGGRKGTGEMMYLNNNLKKPSVSVTWKSQRNNNCYVCFEYPTSVERCHV